LLESSLAQNFSLLRRARSEGNGNTKLYRAIHKRGYRFVADVREVAEPVEDGGFLPTAQRCPTHQWINRKLTSICGAKANVYLAASWCVQSYSKGGVYWLRRERAKAHNFYSP
jgi:hypothetical protein